MRAQAGDDLGQPQAAGERTPFDAGEPGREGVSPRAPGTSTVSDLGKPRRERDVGQPRAALEGKRAEVAQPGREGDRCQVSIEQPLKALLSMLVSPGARVISASPEQPLKARSPIWVSPGGRVISASPEHPSKASIPIWVSPGGSVISASPERAAGEGTLYTRALSGRCPRELPPQTTALTLPTQGGDLCLLLCELASVAVAFAAAAWLSRWVGWGWGLRTENTHTFHCYP